MTLTRTIPALLTGYWARMEGTKTVKTNVHFYRARGTNSAGHDALCGSKADAWMTWFFVSPGADANFSTCKGCVKQARKMGWLK